MHWHEANHIHAWFVDNVQNGSDDRGIYPVSIRKVQELHNLCDQIIAASKLVDGLVLYQTDCDDDHPHGVAKPVPALVIEDPTVAKELLPTRSGYFGRDHYDEWYLKATKVTRDWAALMLADEEDVAKRADLFYTSRW